MVLCQRIAHMRFTSPLKRHRRGKDERSAGRYLAGLVGLSSVANLAQSFDQWNRSRHDQTHAPYILTRCCLGYVQGARGMDLASMVVVCANVLTYG